MLWPELPNPRDLAPWLRKMEKEPGSCLVLTIEPRSDGKRPDVRIAWIAETERRKIRKAMIDVNIERGRAGKPLLTDPPE